MKQLTSSFRALWLAQTVSLLGSEVSFLALPLAAVSMLGATPLEMGILQAARYAPSLLVLLAGVWVDRLQRRPLLVSCDVARAIALASVPILAMFGVLRIEHLYVVAFVAGTATVLFGVAQQAFAQSIVARERLLDANAKLQASDAGSSIVGPGLAGILVQLLTAPIAVLLDCLSFLTSALLIAGIRAREEIYLSRESFFARVREGIATVHRTPVLPTFVVASSMLNFGFQVLFAVYILYATRELRLSAGTLGLVLACGGVSTLLGTAVISHLTKAVGTMKTALLGSVLMTIAMSLVPLATPGWPVVPLVASRLLFGFGSVVYNVTVVTVRQTLVPNELQGRVTATMRFATAGVIPFGALAGGTIGEVFGMRTTLALGTVGMAAGVVYLGYGLFRADVRHDASPIGWSEAK